MDFDISEFFDNIKEAVSNFFDNTKSYFQSLDQWEWVGWGAEALGLTLILVGVIFW